MAAEISMPQLTDTMSEGTIVRWLKKEGERVKAGEIIAEIETDKAVMEQESFEAGTVAHIAVPEGGKVAVGAPIAVLAVGGEDPAAVKKQYASGGGAAPAAAAKPAPASEKQAAPQQQPAAASAPKAAAAAGSPGQGRPPAPAQHSGSVATLEGASMGELHEPEDVGHGATREPATAVPPVPVGGNGHRVRISPLARRIASDKGVDLNKLHGTGPGGRIIQRDVLQYAERAAAAAAAPQPAAAAGQKPAAAAPQVERVPRGETQSIPNSKMRTAIATALQRSKQQVPHFYVTVDVDVEELSNLRVRLNKQLERDGVKVSLNDFVSKAVAAALVRHPALNAHWKDDAIVRYGDVNLGIAVAIPDGLIVPVLRGADQLGLRDLQQRTAELAKKAKAQKLKGDEMKGATFTISNLGMFGVKEFSAIINPPEVGILAVSAAEKRAVVRGDQVVARTVMSLTLSVDHRAVDGATAAEFMRTLKGLLEEPGMMLV